MTTDANAPAEKPASTLILLSDREAAQLLGVSRRKFHELRQEPWMAKAPPRVLGPRMVRYLRSELEQAVMAIPQQKALSEPAQLVRARIQRMKRGARHE